jgi:hypothetical protein
MAYTKKELMGMNKVVLRKIARDAKANMTEAAKLSHEELVDWIMENQDGGEPEEKPKGRGAPARGKPAKEPEEKDEPEEKPRGRRAAPEPEEKDDGGCEGVAELSTKIDTIGNVLDELVKSGTDNYNELQAELFVIKNGLLKLCERLEAEEILTEASQTKGRTMAEEFQKLEDSTRGS